MVDGCDGLLAGEGRVGFFAAVQLPVKVTASKHHKTETLMLYCYLYFIQLEIEVKVDNYDVVDLLMV